MPAEEIDFEISHFAHFRLRDFDLNIGFRVKWHTHRLLPTISFKSEKLLRVDLIMPLCCHYDKAIVRVNSVHVMNAHSEPSGRQPSDQAKHLGL